MPGTVMEALRRFLPQYLLKSPGQDRRRERAIWAITHCRTPMMGGSAHACQRCGQTHYTFHSCNHRSCPQCGAADTAHWVKCELAKRIEADYFMVTFTLPSEVRSLFFSPAARECYDIFFGAASQALTHALGLPGGMRAAKCGFTMVLHTWNQQLGRHLHIHSIVPGAGLDAHGRLVRCKSASYLASVPVLRSAFRENFRRAYLTLRSEHKALPAVPRAVWQKEWGVDVQARGNGAAVIKYLGQYVCRTAISDRRIVDVSRQNVTFRWKDRTKGNAQRMATVPGVEFVNRYLRHVVPRGMRAIRRYGYCHPCARAMRERVALASGVHLTLACADPPPKSAPPLHVCPRCHEPLVLAVHLQAKWLLRGPPASQRSKRYV